MSPTFQVKKKKEKKRKKGMFHNDKEKQQFEKLCVVALESDCCRIREEGGFPLPLHITTLWSIPAEGACLGHYSLCTHLVPPLREERLPWSLAHLQRLHHQTTVDSKPR